MSDDQLKSTIQEQLTEVEQLINNFNTEIDVSDLNQKVESLCEKLREIPINEAKVFIPKLQEIHDSVNKIIETHTDKAESTKEELKNLEQKKKATKAYGNYNTDE